jgi:uncharacterized protein involved in oxidation of intracellular sulfur
VKVLLIINDPPYWTERVYNALRLAQGLAKKIPAAEIAVFLMADAVLVSKAAQKTPDGFYNIERMLKRVLAGNGRVLLYGTGMDARDLADSELMDGTRRSSMNEPATATVEADKNHLAAQDHGKARYRRAAAAPGRADQDRRPRHRH